MNDSDDHQPEVLEAYWDREQVETLFSDLSAGAIVRHVQVRTSSVKIHPEAGTVTLEQARELLDEATTTAIQIYYEYDSRTWCDTLIVLPDTIRVVRTTLPAEG